MMVIRNVVRVLRAFFKAWWLVLRGQAITTPPARPHEDVWAWIQDSTLRLDTVVRIADKAGWGKSQREALKLKLDGRDTSLELVLAALRHNLTREYPMLLNADVAYNLLTLQALNVNDTYRVMRFATHEALAGTPLAGALAALQARLQACPAPAPTPS
jgi:hypothetical protein